MGIVNERKKDLIIKHKFKIKTFFSFFKILLIWKMEKKSNLFPQRKKKIKFYILINSYNKKKERKRISVGGLDTMKTALIHKQIFNLDETVIHKFIHKHNT